MELSNCRYCFESDAQIYPCKCNSAVHMKCLETWVNTRPGNDKKRCEICKEEYNIVIIIDTNYGTIRDPSPITYNHTNEGFYMCIVMIRASVCLLIFFTFITMMSIDEWE